MLKRAAGRFREKFREAREASANRTPEEVAQSRTDAALAAKAAETAGRVESSPHRWQEFIQNREFHGRRIR